MAYFTKLYNVQHRNYIKPGTNESTRVLLRRKPKILLVKNKQDPQVAHLMLLAKDKNVTVEEHAQLPYASIAIIEEVD